MSTHVNKVDRKGRVSVPATFRAELAGLSFQGIVVYPALGQGVRALEATGIDRIRAISAVVDRRSSTDQDRKLAGWLMTKSEKLPFDPEGRVLLPERFLQHARIGESVVFAGIGPSFQIWEPGLWAEKEAALDAEIGGRDVMMPWLADTDGELRQ